MTTKAPSVFGALAYRFGFMFREAAQALDHFGCRLQGNYAFMEELNRHQSIMPIFGRAPEVSRSAFIAPNASVLGSVSLGDHSSVWYGAVLRGDLKEIKVGKNTNIQDNAVIHVTSGIGAYPARAVSIGSNVTVGHGAVLHACTVEDECLIGMGSLVMDGAVVEKNSMVAAGAVVTPGTRVPSGQIWAGNPAKFLRTLTKEEVTFLAKSAANYADLAKPHAEECGKSFEEVWRDKAVAVERRLNAGRYAVDPNPHDKEYFPQGTPKIQMTGGTTYKPIS